VDDFYAARDNTMPSLPWPSIAPPFTEAQANAMASLKDENLADITLQFGTIPLHPGAARWFEEQGIDLPAKLKPAE